MDDNRASAADNFRKNSPSCVGSEKFFSTVVSYEKFNFRLFHCVQPTKIITFERHTFRKLVQMESETVAQFATRIKEQARSCGFGDSDDVDQRSPGGESPQ